MGLLSILVLRDIGIFMGEGEGVGYILWCG